MHFRIPVFLVGFGLASFLPAAWSLPKVGAEAPPIHISHVLSPVGRAVTPRSLAGKTVVLDFWATWCGPCVAAMPHVNDLEASLDHDRFVFIALDDEDAETVEKFLGKKKMNAIVALDQNRSTFTAYGVSERPTTVVIDPNGKVALITKPFDLDRQTLLKISGAPRKATTSALRAQSNHDVRFQNSARTARDVDQRPTSGNDIPLAELSLRRTQPGEMHNDLKHSEDGEQAYVGFNAKQLMRIALHVADKYIEYRDEPPSGSFDFTTKVGHLDNAERTLAMRALLTEGFALEVTETDVQEDVFILKRSSIQPLKLEQSVDQSAAPSVEDHDNQLAFADFSTQDLAAFLGARLGLSVVDETRILGKYDGILHWPSNQQELSEATLRDLGLVLEPGKRNLPHYAISKRKENG